MANFWDAAPIVSGPAAQGGGNFWDAAPIVAPTQSHKSTPNEAASFGLADTLAMGFADELGSGLALLLKKSKGTNALSEIFIPKFSSAGVDFRNRRLKNIR